MKFHIHKKDTAIPVQGIARGYAPMHDAKPLDEFEEELLHPEEAEEENDHGWRSSRRIPILLFCAAVVLLASITYVAKEFQSEENLQGIVIEGNASLLRNEILSLAAIDVKQKFFDIDLKQVEHRIEKHGLIHHVVLRRETHPNRIVIQIEEREPVAMIRSLTGEPVLVDADYKFFLPKRLSGLKNPDKLLSVPLLGGITERDTMAIIQMAKLVQIIRSLNDGAMKDAIGELRRTSTGDLVIYTAASMTPIFIGSPTDERFQTTLEADASRANGDAPPKSLFLHQLDLLATFWQKQLKGELHKSGALYIDARFDGEIIMKKRGGSISHAPAISDSIKQAPLAEAGH
ncbi:MAG: FtsQ-type POTRA domain-containing protein [Ignavibacteriota bacterium]